MASSVQNNRSSPAGFVYNCMCCKVCNRVCFRAFKWIPVLLIISIVTWSYYAYVIQLCICEYAVCFNLVCSYISECQMDVIVGRISVAVTIESTVQKCVYLVIFHILLIMFAWSYWRTIFAEIPPVPDKVSQR